MYNPVDNCVYYDTRDRKLKDAVVRSVWTTTLATENRDEPEVTTVVYHIQCSGTHVSNVEPQSLFDSREHFLAEVL